MKDDDDDDDDTYVDLRGASPEEVLKVFKQMKDEDGIVVTKDGDTIDLDDENEDVHYKISLSEDELPPSSPGMDVEEDMDSEMKEDMEEEYYEDGDDTVDFSDIFMSGEDDEDDEDDTLASLGFDGLEETEDDGDEVVYEIELGEDMDEQMVDDTDADMAEDMDEDMDEAWSKIAEAIKRDRKSVV